MPTIDEKFAAAQRQILAADRQQRSSGANTNRPATSSVRPSGGSTADKMSALESYIMSRDRQERRQSLLGGLKGGIGEASKEQFSAAKTPLLSGYDERADDYDGLFGTLRGVGESALAGIRSANQALAGWLADVTPDAVKENISLVDVDADAARAAASAASGAVQERFGRTEESQEQGRERQQQATDYLTQRRDELDTGADIERLFQEAANSQEEAARIREYTVGDSGAFAQLLFDAGVGGVQMGYDALMNFLIPGSGLASAGLRGAGSGILEAQQSGANTLQQLAYGLGVGAVEAATEKISNLAAPLRRVFGGGVADRAVSSLVNRLTSSTAGRALLNLAANAAGEGFEEFVSSAANPVLRRIFDENALAEYGDPQMWADAAYDALVGATIGGVLGGAGQVIENRANRHASQNAAEAPTAGTATQTGVDTSTGVNPVEAGIDASVRLFNEGGGVIDAQTPNNTASEDGSLISANENQQETTSDGRASQTGTVDTVSSPAGNSSISPAGANVNALADSMTDEQLALEQQRNNADIASINDVLNAAQGGQQFPQGIIDQLPGQLPGLMQEQQRLASVEQAKRVQRGEVSRSFGQPENHIDNRNPDSVKGNRVAAFSFDHPQVHGYFVQAARDLQGMADYAAEAERGRSNRGNRIDRERNRSAVEHAYSRELRNAMESGDLSKPQVLDACQRIIDNHGQENVLAAKRVELILDDMLTNGYTTADGVDVAPNMEYIAAKEQIAGARGAERAIQRYDDDLAIGALGMPYTDAELAEQEAERQRIREQYAALNQPAAQTSQNGEVSATDSTGAAPRGFSVGHAPEYAQNQEHAISNTMGEQYEGPGRHEVLHNRDSMYYAQQRVGVDFEGEMADLRNKQEWDAIDIDTGMLILERLKQESMRAPESATARAAMREWKEITAQRATTAGQSLNAFGKWAGFSAENAYSDAVDVLYGDNVQRGVTDSQKQEILRQTREAAERLEEITPEDTASTIELIKRLSQQRHTTGILRNDTSPLMNRALEHVAQQEGGAEFLRNVAQSQIHNLARDYERVSLTERMKTLRALNLLSKPATTLRNLIGNTVFDPLESISNNIGVGLDMLLSKYTGTRTTAIDQSWFSEAKRRGSVDALMRSIVEVGLDADAEGVQNRYEQGGGRTFRMTGNFVERLLSTWEKYNAYALTSTDEFAKGGTRAEAERGLRDLADRGLLRDNQAAQAEQRRRGQNVLENGTVVRALDRNNFGRVTGYNPESDTYSVHFESRSGSTADVELPASQVVDTKAAGKARRKLTGGRDSQAAYRAQLTPEEYIAQRSDSIAKQRTFQDDTILSDITLGLRDVGNIAHVGNIGAGDVLVPFARVPANVGTQAINYSPAGLVNGLWQTGKVLWDARHGNLTPQQQARAVTSIGRAITGTTGIAMFAALALKGILNVAGADDDEERAFDTGEGLSGTQLNLSALWRWLNGDSTEWQDGDQLMSIGFLEPINAQMAMGAMIADSYVEDGTLTGNDILESTASGVMQSIIDLPAMSSIQELLDSWEYASGDTNVTRAVNAAMSFAGSQLPGFVVPNLVAGIASGLDNTVRAPYLGETAEDDLVNQFLADIPGLRENVPARLDSWGNERTYSDRDVLNFLNSTILPGSVTQYHTNSVNQEIRRLGNFPQRSAPGDFSIDGEKITLTQEQKDAYQQAYGDVALSVLEPLMASSTYQSLSDEEKNKVIDSVYEYANAAAKQTIDNRYKLEGAAAKASEYDNPGEYFLFNEAWKVIEDSKGANTAAFEAVMQDYERMSTQKQNALMEALGEGTRFDDVVDAYEAGIDPERWYDAYDEWRAIDSGEGSATDKATQFAQWLETEGGYSENESNLLQDQLAYYSMIRGNAERYDELRDFGFSPQESYNLYEAIGEMNTFKADKDENGESISGSKKAKVIAFIDALNLTPAEKDILFNEFTTYTGLEDTPWH